MQNRQPGPASMQGIQGRGLDRPFNVKFGPDGAMYIVDYGVVRIDMSLTKHLLGWTLLTLGVLVLTGSDKYLEALAVDVVPDWVFSL